MSENVTFLPKQAQILVREIAILLTNNNETIAVSEAACGGLLSAYLVSEPGASQWFHGGTLVYSLKSRLKLSGWSQEDIDNYTGPGVSVALRLARNLKFELGTTYTLSETGFASNSRNISHSFDNEKVGTVYFGIAGPNGDSSKIYCTESHDRCTNMQSFAIKGLEFLLEKIRENNNINQDRV